MKLFVRFALAKGAITYGMELMLSLFDIAQGAISTIMGTTGFSETQKTVLPTEMVTAIENCSFFESIPLWAVTLIGGLFIMVMSFILIMTVYGRFFKLYMYTALAPIPLSTFAGEPSQNVGKSFIRSYCAVCLEGAAIALACIIFSLFASSPPVVDDSVAAVTQVWSYIGELIFNMVAELTDLNRNLMMSIDVVPVPTDEAVREAENRLLGVETNATNWQRRQNANNNFSAQLPYDIEQQRKEMKEFLDDLTTRDQRMMFAVLTMVHTADTKEQLDNDTEALLTTARRHMCQFGILKFQQLDGLNTALPFGVRKIDSFRTLTTESLAVFIPFRVQDVQHTNGIYYGQNVISKNMIVADRRQLLNGNEFILGVSGGGKSFTAKGEILNQVLAGDADVIIIDPEREYAPLVRALGGEIINISATSPTHINAMDMTREYGDGANPVILKSEFIMSLCEQLIGGSNLGAVQKSIIDRCTAAVYRNYQQNDYTGAVPTLQDFRAELIKQPEPEAQEIALSIELFTNGSLNTFAKRTNVDTDNRLICYDILDLGKQLMPIGMLVVLDSILNRITANRAKGKNTFIFIDEIYLLFQHEYSANFLFTLWKRVRKYGAYATGITQNVDDLLQSHTARTMLANSEFIIMLNQAPTDRIELAKLLNISDNQLSYITNVGAGHGLIKVGSSLIPFANKFPKNTKLYKLMTTKPGEEV